jgi:transcriptional regulator with XRE-family HTH domain
MTSGPTSPTVRQRRLAQELKRMREDAGRTIADAARELGCASSKISRIENVVSRAHWRDVRDLARFYGGSAAKVEELVALAQEARHRGWWHSYGGSVREKYAVFIGLEAEAVRCQMFEVSVIPGLLQTDDYTRAIMAASDVDAAVTEDRIEVRRRRQEALTRQHSPLRLHAIVDEAALRRPFGSAAVMRRQLDHLADAAALPNVTLQVLPFSAGGHPATTGPFIILELPEDTQPVVFLENIRNDLYVEKREDIDGFRLLFERLHTLALDPDESVAFVQRMARRHR